MERCGYKILHMYPDLMNLYGDWANIAALERELAARGYEVTVEKKSIGDDIDFSVYDFICLGSGTERSLIACIQDLMRYKDVLINRINAGTHMLATGNSHELFGKAVTDSAGITHEMLGLLDFDTVQLNTRITGDCICNAAFLKEKLIGFINRAGGGQKGDIERPFSIEPGEGANYSKNAEGIRFKNLLGTYMTGPILVRNPPLLKYIADSLTETDLNRNRRDGSWNPPDDAFFTYQERAYNTALSKL